MQYLIPRPGAGPDPAHRDPNPLFLDRLLQPQHPPLQAIPAFGLPPQPQAQQAQAQPQPLHHPPQPDLMSPRPALERPPLDWSLLGHGFQGLLEATADKLNAFTLGVRLAQTADQAVLHEFLDTLARLRYLSDKVETAVASAGPFAPAD